MRFFREPQSVPMLRRSFRKMAFVACLRGYIRGSIVGTVVASLVLREVPVWLYS